jgi:uncharacterized ion transporter superfamily protein YfcC
MQEEIIGLMPMLLLLGGGLGIEPVVVVAMSSGAAMIGSAFGPTNPFQAGIALRLAQLPPFSSGLLRLTMFLLGIAAWSAFTMYYAVGRRTTQTEQHAGALTRFEPKHAIALLAMMVPMGVYVYGALAMDWGLNELSGAFFVGTLIAGWAGGFGLGATMAAYLEGMQALLPPAFMIGLARSISLVLTDGRVVDTILDGLVSALAGFPPIATAFLMVPFHVLMHVPIPSVSGHAMLTMPLMVPLADLLGLPRDVPVLAYQVGAGLCELFTPTNGAIMATLLAAKVPYGHWVAFAAPATVVPLLIGLAGIAIAAAG